MAPLRILVVDDEAALRRGLRQLFSQRGHAVETAESCATACAVGERFDVAVLDLNLLDGEGDTLAEALITLNLADRVVFYTGSRDAGLIARAQQRGRLVMKDRPVEELVAAAEGDNDTDAE